MAADFIDNPRRFPRVPARLRVGVSSRGDGFQAETEDVGPGGCLLVSPRQLAEGAQVRLAVAGGDGAGQLSVLGRVAWSRSGTRMRAGVAFDGRQPGAVDPIAWFRRFLAAQPGLASRVIRAPERLYLDGPLYLLPPPRFILDLSAEEVELLQRIDNGVVPRSLIEGRPGKAQATIRALFSLFEKRVLTLSMGQSVPVGHWKAALASLREEPMEPSAPSGAAAGEARRASVQAPPVAAGAPAPAAGPAPGRGARPPAAQECLDRARTAVASGDYHAAIALLRKGIQLSPRDGEIAALLGELAFRGRQS